MFMKFKGSRLPFVRSSIVTGFVAALFFFTALHAQAQQPEWIYHTLKDDTIWDICLKYTNKRGCWITLTKYNQIANDRAIPVNTPIRIPVGWLKTPLAVGSVIYVTGNAEYSQWGDQQYTKLISGQKVHLGGIVRTQTASLVKLLLHETNEVLIKENSELLLEKFSSAEEAVLQEEMSLKKGGAEAEVNSGKIQNRFIIKTPAAIASVRGTEFRINSSGEQMRGEVLEGNIDVSSDASSQSVPAGFGVAATKGKKILPPKALPPKPQMPKDPVKSALPAKVSWKPIDKVGQYQASLYDKKGQILAIDTVDNNWITYSSLEKGCYQVKVHGIDSEGFHGIDNQASLCILDELAQAVIPAENGLKDRGSNLVLFWQTVPEADSYKVQMSADEEFTNIIQELTTSETQAVFAKVKDQKVYFRTIAMDNQGRVGAPSDVQEYTDRSLLKSILGTAFLIGIAFL